MGGCGGIICGGPVFIDVDHGVGVERLYEVLFLLGGHDSGERGLIVGLIEGERLRNGLLHMCEESIDNTVLSIPAASVDQLHTRDKSFFLRAEKGCISGFFIIPFALTPLDVKILDHSGVHVDRCLTDSVHMGLGRSG